VLVEAAMNRVAPFGSILFDRPSDRDEHDDPSMFSDLNLDQVFDAVAAGREEYELMPLFHCPLRDARAVEYRHQVQRDLEDEAVSQAVAEFADRMREMRRHLVQADKLRHRYQKEQWLLDATGIYCEAVAALNDALAATGLRSRGFVAFRQHLAEYTTSPAFTGLVADIATVKRLLDEVRYCITIKGNRVRVTSYEGEADYGAEVQKTFAKFAENEVKDYRIGFRSWPEMNHVEEHILELVARLFPDVFRALDEFCVRYDRYVDGKIRRFDKEIQFYLAYQAFIAAMKAAGLEFCYPAVSASSKEITARGSFDLALAVKLMPRASAVVRNDFHLAGPERIFVVTGPNHGGKTTFARTFGQLHYLASLGFPVPATEASVFLPDRVFTHFEREEDLATLRGKFEDELVRIRGVLEQATGDSVLVMNESFASTTLRDALFVGERVLDRMTGLGLLGVYVTFVDELASLNEACVSMVATVVPDNPAERTYELVRKPADGLAYAAAIAGKYGLTYRQLKERLAS
jgi:DNA mismatch repair protein MutS